MATPQPKESSQRQSASQSSAICQSQPATQSTISQSLPDTQPANDIHSQTPEVGSWAKLDYVTSAKSKNNSCSWLKSSIYKFGKLPECDLVADSFDPDVLGGISKVQFVIEKIELFNKPIAVISDRSSNGTFINRERLGVNEKRVLGHNDYISIIKTNYQFFTFRYLGFAFPNFPNQVKTDYHVIERILSGRFTSLYYVVHKKSCQYFAMKTRRVVADFHTDEPFKELQFLRSLKHKNIVEYHDCILTDTELYLFTEYMDGGNLNSWLRLKGPLSESLAQNVGQQLISGLHYLHSQKVIHKDIQPKNILLRICGDNLITKLSNFKKSKKLRKKVAKVKAPLGTSVYLAPELKRDSSEYDQRVDVWSYGVLLYVCLCGREPVEGAENNDINGEKISFSPRDMWSKISPFAKNLIRVSLITNYRLRPSSVDILSEPWFTMYRNQATKRPNILSNSTPKRFAASRTNQLFKPH